MATVAQMCPRPEPNVTLLKREVNDYLQRAANLERQQQHAEASVLYRRVVSLISSHEGTSSVDAELAALKRDANQRLMQSSLQKNRMKDSDGQYRTMVRQLSSQLSHQPTDKETAEMNYEIFQDPTAFQPVTDTKNGQDGNSVVLFELESGAKLFYLAKDGTIQTTSETLPLTVYRVIEDGEDCGLLKLGTWIYPLHPKVSPAFKTGYDAYIFPNNTTVGEFVGLMFDENVTPDIRQYFERVLSKYSVFMAQPGTQTFGEFLAPTGKSASRSPRTDGATEAENRRVEILGRDVVIAQQELPYDTTTATGKFAAALITGTQYLTKQLATGVVMAENFIEKTSKNIHDKIVPNAEPVKVNRGLHVTARGLRWTSGVTVKASGYVVSKVGSMTLALARTFAPNFGGVPKKVNSDGSVEVVKLSGLRGIGHAGLASYGVIFESCENAAKHLATNLANESISVVKYKYGEDASVLTENAAYAVGNTALTAYNVSNLGPKGIATKVVKQTAKETLKNAFK